MSVTYELWNDINTTCLQKDHGHGFDTIIKSPKLFDDAVVAEPRLLLIPLNVNLDRWTTAQSCESCQDRGLDCDDLTWAKQYRLAPTMLLWYDYEDLLSTPSLKLFRFHWNKHTCSCACFSECLVLFFA